MHNLRHAAPGATSQGSCMPPEAAAASVARGRRSYQNDAVSMTSSSSSSGFV